VNVQISIYKFITLLCVKIAVKGLIKCKWRCSVDTWYSWLEDMKLLVAICKRWSNVDIRGRLL